jgi:preprotein translocase SecE subunit
MKWFSIKGIREEMKKTRWPNRKDMLKDVTTVLVFIGLFALFFEITSGVVLAILRVLGVIG